MAERTTTARPYAKAIFALARKSNSLGNTSIGLQRAATVVLDPVVHDLLTSPHVKPAQLAGLVTDIAGPSLDENGRDFVSLLAQNRRLGFLPEIAALFEQMKSDVENAVTSRWRRSTPPDQEGRYAATESWAAGCAAHRRQPRWCRAQDG
jgi:F-type H+-transporting ATPase subunit delta